MEIVEKRARKSNAKIRVESAMKMLNGTSDVESRIALIQQLIPIGLMAVEDALQSEVEELAGVRYRRDDNSHKRWGSNLGSVHLGDQKHSIRVPRVRNQMLAQVINGISTRKFKKAAMQIPSTFSIQKSSVSRKFIQATAKKLRAFQDRDLKGHEIIVIFMDGKSFAENEMIVALGVTLSGEKIVLGAIESSTENGQVCRDFLNQLMERGLQW